MEVEMKRSDCMLSGLTNLSSVAQGRPAVYIPSKYASISSPNHPTIPLNDAQSTSASQKNLHPRREPQPIPYTSAPATQVMPILDGGKSRNPLNKGTSHSTSFDAYFIRYRGHGPYLWGPPPPPHPLGRTARLYCWACGPCDAL